MNIVVDYGVAKPDPFLFERISLQRDRRTINAALNDGIVKPDPRSLLSFYQDRRPIHDHLKNSHCRNDVGRFCILILISSIRVRAMEWIQLGWIFRKKEEFPPRKK